jgi:hypothetical protein
VEGAGGGDGDVVVLEVAAAVLLPVPGALLPGLGSDVPFSLFATEAGPPVVPWPPCFGDETAGAPGAPAAGGPKAEGEALPEEAETGACVLVSFPTAEGRLVAEGAAAEPAAGGLVPAGIGCAGTAVVVPGGEVPSCTGEDTPETGPVLLAALPPAAPLATAGAPAPMVTSLLLTAEVAEAGDGACPLDAAAGLDEG